LYIVVALEDLMESLARGFLPGPSLTLQIGFIHLH
jgi:hypothetical protein